MTKPPPASAYGTPSSTAFDPIEAALREIFDGIEGEPVPDDFAALVAQFGKKKAGEA